MSLLGYSKIIPIPNLNTLGSFDSYAPDKQTDEQTEPNIIPMPPDSVGVRYYNNFIRN